MVCKVGNLSEDNIYEKICFTLENNSWLRRLIFYVHEYILILLSRRKLCIIYNNAYSCYLWIESVIGYCVQTSYRIYPTSYSFSPYPFDCLNSYPYTPIFSPYTLASIFWTCDCRRTCCPDISSFSPSPGYYIYPTYSSYYTLLFPNAPNFIKGFGLSASSPSPRSSSNR